MIPQLEHGRIVRFGVFELDLAAGQLRKSGVRLKLQEQPFQVLAALLEKPGEVITREELKERLWSGDTFVDFERGVNTAINKIREALGDSARSPLFIETVPRRGYRFIAELRAPGTVLEAGDALAGMPSSELLRQAPGRRRLWFSLVLVFTVAVFALGAWALRDGLPRGSSGRESANALRAVPVTTTAGRELYPSLSPDGSQVAFSADFDGQPGLDIYVKLVGAGEALRLTTDPDDDVSPAWSPDGKTIAFVRLRPAQKIEVYLVPSLKGAEVKIHEVDSVAGVNPNSGPLVAWAPDSRRLAVPCRVEATGGLGLCLLSCDNRDLTALTKPRAELLGDTSPAFSPDGRRLAFTRQRSLNGGTLHVLDLDEDLRPSGEPQRLPDEHRRCGSPVWTPDGSEIVYFAGGVDSDKGIWRRPARRRGEPTLLHPLEDVTTLTMSRRNLSSGSRLIYSAMVRDSNIWRIRLSDSARDTPVKDRFIFSTWRDRHAQFSPDGRKVVFASSRSGASELWLCNNDGSNPHPITNLEAAIVGFPRWSADGDKLVFMARPDVQSDIYVLDVREGKPRRLTTNLMDDIGPGWSRDDQWVYFSRVDSGGPQLWKMPVEGGDEIQLTTQGGMIPFESWEGQTVYYSKPDHKLYRMPVAEQLLEGPGTEVLASVNPTSFLVFKQRLYFIEDNPRYGNVYPTGYGETLKYLDLVTGKVAEVAPIQSPLDFGLTVSPDGRTVLYTQDDQAGSDLMMLGGFGVEFP